MPRAALSHDEISAFREQIIAAAAHLFAEEGYAAVTMRRLATAVGCSPMTPYRYFDGKDEIFALVKAQAYRRFTASQQAAAAEAQHHAAASLAALGRAYIRFAVDEPDAYRIMFQLHHDPGDEYAALRAEGEAAWQVMRDTIGRAVGEGLLEGDPDTVAHIFWAGVHGLVSLHLAGKLALGRDLDALMLPVMTMLFRGCAPGGVIPDEAAECALAALTTDSTADSAMDGAEKPKGSDRGSTRASRAREETKQ